MLCTSESALRVRLGESSEGTLGGFQYVRDAASICSLPMSIGTIKRRKSRSHSPRRHRSRCWELFLKLPETTEASLTSLYRETIDMMGLKCSLSSLKRVNSTPSHSPLSCLPLHDHAYYAEKAETVTTTTNNTMMLREFSSRDPTVISHGCEIRSNVLECRLHERTKKRKESY